jgi:hypothetical protein
MEAIGLAMFFCSVASAALTCASVDWARSMTGLAATMPKRATKKRTEREANLENCIVRVKGGGRG